MSNEYKDWYNDLTEQQKKNSKLCIKYPILAPRSYLTGEVVNNYMYEYTELDQIPVGWRVAFGEQWAAEVQKAIDKLPENVREQIYIMQLKEKFGFFRQYFSHYTDELDEVIRKYELLSRRTCIKCGAPATKMSTGWISPYCNSCVEDVTAVRFVDIDECFKERDEDDSDNI